jgi:plastocyanin
MRKFLFPAVLMTTVLVGAACSSDPAETTTTAPVQTTTTTAAETTTTAAETTTTAAGDTVNIVDFTFRPDNLTVPVGATVTWTNGDGPGHTTSSDADGWDSGVMASGETFQVVFDEPGTFAYHCNIHPFMKATITVEG